MNIKQLNEALYKNNPRVGTKEHCVCDDCLDFAAHIDNNTELIQLLAEIGLHPLQADEVWCYNEEAGYKHYSVDFFGVHASEEVSYTLTQATVVIHKNPFAKAHELPYAVDIDVCLKLSSHNNSAE